MLAQINFTINRELKSKLHKKLKGFGLTFKVFFVFCTEAYLNNEITISVLGDEDTPPKWLLKQFKSQDRILLSEAAFLLKRIRASSRREMREEIEEKRSI